MTDPHPPALRLIDISVTVTDGSVERAVLDRVTLEVGSGELVAVMGPSGAGKSTLIDVACGLARPTAGTIELLGLGPGPWPARWWADRRRDRIGVVHPRLNLLGAMTALDNVALALDLRIDDISQYELFYGRQSTSLERDPALGKLDIDVEYLHLGGTIAMEGQRRVIPYLAGGLGATRFSPDAASDKTRFSISLGGGVKVPFNERFALRLEGRGYLTFVDTDTSFFCRSDEGGAVCRIHGSGSTFFQFELLAGAAFAF